eukprot:2549337-Amphidinium_carterae.1
MLGDIFGVVRATIEGAGVSTDLAHPKTSSLLPASTVFDIFLAIREGVAARTHFSGSELVPLEVTDELLCVCGPCAEITLDFGAVQCP